MRARSSAVADGAAERRFVNPVRRSAATLALLVALTCGLSCGTTPSMGELVVHGTERLVAFVDEVVGDPERSAAARRVLTDYLAAETEWLQTLDAHRRTQARLNADPLATREAFEQLDEALDVRRDAFVETTLAALLELRGHLEPGEWSAAFARLRAHDERWEALIP